MAHKEGSTIIHSVSINQKNCLINDLKNLYRMYDIYFTAIHGQHSMSYVLTIH